MGLVNQGLETLLPVAAPLLPPGWVGRLLEGHPERIAWLPLGKTVRFRKYLGDLTIVANTLYPIERSMLSGMYDGRTVKVIKKFVCPDAICFDIGANVGAITLAIAQVLNASGHVYAFEPGPFLCQRLQTNLALNPAVASRVSVHPIGIASQPGSLKWAEDMNNRGNAGLLNGEGLEVPVTTLDQFCQQQSIARLNFIKVDVEGMEYEVFQGAATVLKTLRPILYFETLAGFIPIRGFNIFEAIEQLLTDCGYTLYKIVGVKGKVEIVKTTAADFSKNTLALPMESPANVP